jgi:hypothetical protein
MDLHYFLHGLIILMVGLLGGFPFAKAIKEKNGKETAWRVVHSGSSAGGVMLIAIGAIVGRLTLSLLLNSFIAAGIIISTYLFIIGMLIAAITGERGIGNSNTTQKSSWKIVYYLYGLGAVISILSIAVLIIVCLKQLVIE